jgi:cbb3-type cytochrome oxidase maturation protein
MTSPLPTLFAAATAANDGTVTLTAADVVVLLMLVGSIVFFGGAAVLALGWAFRNGQFENFQQGAASIFGPDEPIGEPTDSFPGQRPDATPPRNLDQSRPEPDEGRAG